VPRRVVHLDGRAEGPVVAVELLRLTLMLIVLGGRRGDHRPHRHRDIAYGSVGVDYAVGAVQPCTFWPVCVSRLPLASNWKLPSRV